MRAIKQTAANQLEFHNRRRPSIFIFYFRRVGRRIGERRASGSREAKGI